MKRRKWRGRRIKRETECCREGHRLQQIETKEESKKLAKMVRTEGERLSEVHLGERTLASILDGKIWKTW